MNTESKEHTPPADQSWFEKKSNLRIIIFGLIIVCIGLVLAEFTFTNDHPHFELEKFKGFQAIFGFVAFVVIVFLGMGLRLIIERDEDYYDG